MTTKQIEQRMQEIQEQLQPLQAECDWLERELRRLKSLEWIRVNGVTQDDIEMSSGDDRPYFLSLPAFRDWLKKQPSVKRFAEWNGVIYHTTDVLEDNIRFNMPGRVSDLQE